VRAPEPLIARLARLLAVHHLGGNVPAQLAAAELVARLDELSARQAPARQARHDHLRAELARHLPGWNVPPAPGGQALWVRTVHRDVEVCGYARTWRRPGGRGKAGRADDL
jgi:DNA-binding transcriptional MocR family regulator